MSSSKDNFGFISYFTCVNHKYYAIVEQLINVHPIGSVHHVFACNKVLGPIVIVPIDAIISKVVFMSFSDTDDVYVAKFPNYMEITAFLWVEQEQEDLSAVHIMDRYYVSNPFQCLQSTESGS
jgi:hypothetical protein